MNNPLLKKVFPVFAVILFIISAAPAFAENFMQMPPLQNMQRNTARTQSDLRRLEKLVGRAQKAGYGPQTNLLENLAQAKEKLSVIQNASEFSEPVEDAMIYLEDFFSDTQDEVQNLQMLLQFSRTIKKSEKDFSAAVRKFERIKKTLNGFSAQVSDVQNRIDALRNSLDEAKQFAQTGDGQSALDVLEESFWPDTDDLFRSIGSLGEIKNVRRNILMIERGLADSERAIARLSEAGIDMTEAMQIFNQSKAALDELKNLLANDGINFNADSAFSIMSRLDDLRWRFERIIRNNLPAPDFTDENPPFINHPPFMDRPPPEFHVPPANFQFPQFLMENFN